MPKTSGHSWRFKARFRRHAFGWKSQPAIARLQEAVSEITLVARIEPILGAEGAVALLERISPALENVDSSSGAIGTAVNHTIAELVSVIVAAPADEGTRAAWLERLFEAHAADQIPYIERLAEYWGELCVTAEVASGWADRLIGITRLALSPDKTVRGYFHATSACLSALFTAGRYDELIDLVRGDHFWPYKRWAVKAMVAQGRDTSGDRIRRELPKPLGERAGDRRALRGHPVVNGSARRGLFPLRPFGEPRPAPISRGFGPWRRSIRTSRARLCSQIWYGSLLAMKASGSLRQRTPSSSTRRLLSQIGRRAIPKR